MQFKFIFFFTTTVALLFLSSTHISRAHIIPTAKHVHYIKVSDTSLVVATSIYFEPALATQIKQFLDNDNDGKIDDEPKFQSLIQKNYDITIENNIQLIEKTVMIPDLDGLINLYQPITIQTKYQGQNLCKNLINKNIKISDKNIFTDIEHESYDLSSTNSGCVTVHNLNYSEHSVTGTFSNKPPLFPVFNSDLDSLFTKSNSNLFFYILLSFSLGALHALTPGHGKTIIATFLAGEKSTIKDAWLLAVLTTIVHTSGVFILGLLAVFAKNIIDISDILPSIRVISAILIILVGTLLLYKNFFKKTFSKEHIADHNHHHDHHHSHSHTHHHDHQHNHDHNFDHDHNHDHEHGHSHAHHKSILNIFKKHHHYSLEEIRHQNTPSLLMIGISGGLNICPEALVIMIIAINLNQAVLGIFILLFFSIGIGFTLFLLGFLAIKGRDTILNKINPDKYFQIAPLFSSVVIIIIGVYLLTSSL
jgi:ABC-type nickel/cobalt efflux system permease component RcnA